MRNVAVASSIIAVVWAVVTGCTVTVGDSVDANEPNDSLAEATAYAGSTLDAKIDDVADEDWYQFTTANDTIYDSVLFTVDDLSRGLFVTLEIYDDAGGFIGDLWNDVAGEAIEFDLRTLGGTFYARVTSDGITTGSYQLTIADNLINDTYEPNEDTATAHDFTDLPLSADILGAIVHPQEADFYKFTTENSGEYDEVLISIDPVAAELGATLTVYDDGGTELDTMDSANAGALVDITLVTLGGTFYVSVTGYGDTMGDYTLSIANQYANDGYEVNETIGTAHDLTTLPLAADILGAIVHPDEFDFYKFTTENSGEYDEVLISIDAVDTELGVTLTVYDDVQAEILSVESANAGAQVSTTLLTLGGTFYVSVSSYGSTTGDYTLSIANQYANDGYEPNEDLATAYVFTDPSLSVDILGAIVHPDELDFYKFTAENSGYFDEVLISIDAVDAELGVRLTVYDDGGSQIRTVDSANPGALVDITLVTLGGTYYVSVSGYGGTYGDYTLSIANQFANDGFEPNDDWTSAHYFGAPLVSGETGVIVHTSEADWYSVDILANEKLNFYITSVTLDAMNLEFYDSVGQFLGSVDNGMGGADIENIEFWNTGGDGILYFRIIGYAGSTGEYTMDVTSLGPG